MLSLGVVFRVTEAVSTAYNGVKMAGKPMATPTIHINLASCSLLASGSDDLDLRIWSPLEGRSVTCMPTGHTGNIFSVKVKCSRVRLVVDYECYCSVHAIYW